MGKNLQVKTFHLVLLWRGLTYTSREICHTKWVVGRSAPICGWAHSVRQNSHLECTFRHRDWHHSSPKNLLHNCRQQFSQQPTQLRWDKGHSLTSSNPPLTLLKCQHTDQGDVQPTKA